MIKGKCPICEGKLFLNGAGLTCENGDYEVVLSQFEGRWEQYENDWMKLTEKLIEDLVSYNQKKGDKK